jgi:hypothetical protein
MEAIWKYELEFNGITKLQMPKYAEILSLQTDKKTNKPCIWAVVNSSNEEVERTFELFGTGQSIQYNAGMGRKFIGTYQYQRGEFVGHVFERVGI